MRRFWWTSGVLAVVVGCSGVDQPYSPGSRPLVSDRSMQQVPGPTVPAWQANRGPLAHRTAGQGFPSNIGAANPGPGQPLTGGFGGVAAGGSLPGQPVPDARATPPATLAAGTDSGFSNVQRTGFEERPLRGVPADVQGRVPDMNRTPGAPPPPNDHTQPLLMAGPENTQNTQKTPLDDGSILRQTMRPSTPGDTTDPAARSLIPAATTPPSSPVTSVPTTPPALPPATTLPTTTLPSTTPPTTTPPSGTTGLPSTTLPAAPPSSLPTIPEQVAPPAVAQGGAKSEEVPGLPPPVAPPKTAEDPPAATTGAATNPPTRMIKTKRIVMNFELKEVGPSGVYSIELWYTRDGRSWNKDESASRQGPPCVFEAPEDGMYGFTILAKSGVGLGKQPPQAGDQPQVWVTVDTTKPAIGQLDVRNGEGLKGREVTVTWNAQDVNLARRPISLFHAPRPEGPWTPIAANIENSGQFSWTVPTSGPATFYTRLEVVDQVGNMGVAQTAKAISIDMSQPQVNILGIEAGDR